jgi:hypothetical protein
MGTCKYMWLAAVSVKLHREDERIRISDLKELERASTPVDIILLLLSSG